MFQTLEQLYLIPHINQIFKFKNKNLNYVDSFKYQNLKAVIWAGCSHVRFKVLMKLRQEDCLNSCNGDQTRKLSEASCPSM